MKPKELTARMQTIEAQLPPDAIIADWLSELIQFDCAADYLNWAREDWPARSPIPRLLQNALDASNAIPGSALPAGLLHSLSFIKFLQVVVWEANLQGEELLGCCRNRLKQAAAILDLVHLFCRTKKQAEMGPGCGLEPPHYDFAPDAADKLLSHLKDALTAITDTQSDLVSMRLAAGRLSKDYFGEKEFLFPSLIRAIEELVEDASHCAEMYNRLAHDIVQGEDQIDIDFDTVQQAAQTKADIQIANIIAYSDIMMRAAFGDPLQVFKRLQGIMETRTRPGSDGGD